MVTPSSCGHINTLDASPGPPALQRPAQGHLTSGLTATERPPSIRRLELGCSGAWTTRMSPPGAILRGDMSGSPEHPGGGEGPRPCPTPREGAPARAQARAGRGRRDPGPAREPRPQAPQADSVPVWPEAQHGGGLSVDTTQSRVAAPPPFPGHLLCGGPQGGRAGAALLGVLPSGGTEVSLTDP